MIRVMIFIDFLNFEVNLGQHYDRIHETFPKLDYNTFPRKLANHVPESRLVRTYVFAPKPDTFLMQDRNLKSNYDWLNGTLKSIRYLKVIEGEYIARPTRTPQDMNINDKTTYYKEEKGTDVNIATYMLSKAFNNAYDCAILLSGDTDYLPVIKQVSEFGKIVLVGGVKDQNLRKQKEEADDIIILDKTFFDSCHRRE